MLRKCLPLLVLVWALSLCYSHVGCAAAPANDAAAHVTWGYKGSLGPEFWGRLSPRFAECSEGKVQSPIDIAKNDVTVANTLFLHYSPSELVLLNDGMTTLTIGKRQTIFNDGHTLQINFNPKKAKEMISFAGDDYRLVQLHFHSPSENQINGESAPLEIHFVHQGDHGKVAVIGVLVIGGHPSMALQKVIDHIPAPDGKEHVIKQTIINPADFFPMDNDYYSFPGSLTTPPCTQGLQWIVMASTITASPAQIATIRQAIGGSNSRAVQPLNQRIIAYSPERAS